MVQNGQICPVKAYKNWKKTTTLESDCKPAFRLETGKPLTSTKFNKYLKMLLNDHIDYQRGKITSHSFRAGIATLLGTLGYTDEEIKAVGRWSSRAFEDYLKLPRTKRLAMAKNIGNLGL